MFYLTTHSTHFIYGYMVSEETWDTLSDWTFPYTIKFRTRLLSGTASGIANFRLAARVLLYVSSHRQNNTYHGLCYTSCGALAGTTNSSMGRPLRIDPTTYRTVSGMVLGQRCLRSLCGNSRIIYLC